MRLRLVPLSLAAGLLLSGPLQADLHPNTERGFAAEKAFQTGELDHVNLFNGNLVITLPIGGSYPVDAGLSYGLTLVYNAQVWDWEEDCLGSDCYPRAYPGRRFNAGLGWQLSMGQLFDAFDANSSCGACYMSPDGAEHAFYNKLHEDDAEDPGDSGTQQSTLYTRDGTYLRLRITNGVREVNFPDGRTQRFDAVGRPVWIRDRFGNEVTIARLTGPLRWEISDRHGRVQKVYFRTDLPQYLEVVDRVELSAFNGAVATWQFEYGRAFVPRACPHVDHPSLPALPNPVEVPLLTRVLLPDGSTYEMPLADYETSAAASCKSPGVLEGLRLPTLGKVEWTYRSYGYPVDSGGVPWRDASLGVATRALRDAAGTALGTWTYQPSLTPPGGTQSSPAREAVRTVISPLGDKTEHFFSVYPIYSPTGWSASDYGLPFTRNVTDGSPASRFLSTRTWDCDPGSPDPVNCQLRRTTYVTYQLDNGDSATYRSGNPRVSSTRTDYQDDAGVWEAADHSDFDGLGHYRQTVLSGTFNTGNVRTSTTAFNPGRGTYPGSFSNLAPSAPWVLGTYTERSTTEGGVTARTQHCFDAATGFLLRRRVLAGASPAAHDVVVRYTPSIDGRGNVEKEESFGGDLQGGMGTSSDLCGMGLPAAEYGLHYSYENGALKTSQSLTGAGGLFVFKELDRDVDASTGLTKISRDTAGLATSYEYDLLGRLTWAKPGIGHGAWVQNVYARATSGAALARVTTQSFPNGATTGALTTSKVLFDAFGRPWRDEVRMPDGTSPQTETLYNALGWKTSVSERNKLSAQTRFLDYDPFGRPRRIVPPDGAAHEVTLQYAGVRSVSRTVRVATASASESAATTTELYDRQGRLFQVTEPNGTVTLYGYDVVGRLSRVCANSSATSCGQQRWFTYDQRGFLLYEEHPEKGWAGNGWVSYSSYDSRGHAGRRVDGPNDLTFTYDRAERLTQVRETSGGQRPLKTFRYADANAAGNWKRGKLDRADRYNYVEIGGFPHTVLIRHGYTYGGRDGRLSERVTENFIDGAVSPNESIWQGWTYNALGDVTRTEYPRFTAGSCSNIGGGRVDSTYSEGRLTGSGYLSSLSYHPNGMVHRVAHPNGITEVYGYDPDGMARPASITARHVATGVQRWATGAYAYDGAGNVKAIGNSVYLYDNLSRLKEVRLDTTPLSNGSRLTRSYTYDVYGNLQSINGAGGRSTPTSGATNRHSGSTYDSVGNVTFWNGQRYGYDALGSLWRHCTENGCYPSGEEWLHLYDADDERIFSYKVGPAVVRWTPRDLGGQVLRQYTADPHATCVLDSVYVYRDGLLAAEALNELYFSLDHLGTPRRITDRWGNDVAYHAYWPYGEEATAFNQDAERLKFTGHERDLNNPAGIGDDLDYMHARSYSFLTGRFLSFDPVGGNPHAPQSWNRYSYVLGNPMKYVDPHGLRPSPPPVGMPLEDYYYLEGITTGYGVYRPHTADRLFYGGLQFGGILGIAAGAPGRNKDFASQVFANVAASTGWIADAADQGARLFDLATGYISAVDALVAGEPGEVGVALAMAAIPGSLDNAALAGFRGITGFTRHGLHRAISGKGVGVSTKAMLDAVKSPIKVSSQGNGRLKYVGKDATVVLNQSGKVITTFATSSSGFRIPR